MDAAQSSLFYFFIHQNPPCLPFTPLYHFNSPFFSTRLGFCACIFILLFHFTSSLYVLDTCILRVAMHIYVTVFNMIYARMYVCRAFEE